MQILKKLCVNHGTTVIISIHQPRSQIFEIFNDIILLSSGGNIVYCGEASLSIQHFIEKGYVYPPNYNPADFLIDSGFGRPQ